MKQWGKKLIGVAQLVIVALIIGVEMPNTQAQGTLTPRAYFPFVARGYGLWRPFSADSPFNVPIGPNPKIDPNSAAMIASLDPSGAGRGFWINKDEYTIPIYYADASTPIRYVRCTNPWNKWGPGFDGYVPIPNGAIPDPTTDAVMVIVDLAQNKSWDMAQVRYTSSGWEAYTGLVFDLTGLGIRTTYPSSSARESGFAAIAGVIRLEEIQQGYIPHALVFGYKTPRKDVYVYPASACWNCTGGSNTLPMGARIQLDPTLNLDSLGLSRTGKIIARALQEYGAYLAVKADGRVLFAEGLYGKPGLSWDGILDSRDVQTISSLHFRVLELPPLRYMP